MKGKVLADVLLSGAAATAVAYRSYRGGRDEADHAWRDIEARATAAPDGEIFNEAMLSGLPEIAQRYFRHAIAPGTLLRSAVRIDMSGTFLLGDKDSYQTFDMRARQILRPPHEFAWIPEMRSGAMRISGSDVLVQGSAWTRFWLMRLVPVANVKTSPDLVRSAEFRAAMEGVWVPAGLLPQNGARWEQIGPDKARVHLRAATQDIALDLTLTPDGSIREIVGQRWSDANRDKKFRLQPFGGTVEQEATFGGYTIPSRLSVGNHYGTPDYLPFFQVNIDATDFI